MMVEVDIHLVLISELDISWRKRYYFQTIDYWDILFRCTRCHKTGHICKQCPRLDSYGIAMYSSFEVCTEEDSKVQCHSSQIRD